MSAPSDERASRARLAGRLLWLVLVASIAVWALLLWHPWIDWFGRPR